MAVRVQVPLRVQVVPCKTLTYRAFYFIWYKRTTLPLLLGSVVVVEAYNGSVRKIGCKVAVRSRLIIGTKSFPGFFQQHRLLAKVLSGQPHQNSNSFLRYLMSKAAL